MYNLRKQYHTSNPLNLIAKLLMNSLYGKVGMSPELTKLLVYDTSTTEKLDEFMKAIEQNGENIKDFTIDKV